MPAVFAPGKVIAGKYRVERILGEGGMGVVLLARHQQLDQQVALKFMHSSNHLPPEAVTRFLREARAVAKLRGENVARVLDADTTSDGSPYIVMEYLEGRDLSSLIDEGPIDRQTAVDYVLQACVGLAEAHAQGIVHRDLKPANLFLTRTPDGDPLIKILDFGISKLKSEDDLAGSTTRTGTVMGSPLYMPPEQARSAKNVDARADIWSLGAVLYTLITQHSPFRADNVADLFTEILHHPHVPITEHAPDLPLGLARVIDRCLAKQPDERHANLAAFTQALADYGSADGPRLARRVARLTGEARVSDPLATRMASDPTVLEPAFGARAPAMSTPDTDATAAPLSVTQTRGPSRALWLGGAAFACVAIVSALVIARGSAEPKADPTPVVSQAASAPPPSEATTVAPPRVEPAPEPVASASASAAPSAGDPSPRTKPPATSHKQKPRTVAATPAKSATQPKAEPPKPKPAEDPFGTMQ